MSMAASNLCVLTRCWLLQYYADSNEAESWMKEKMPLVKSTDFGKDESSAKVSLPHFGRSCVIVGHHRLTDELFPAAAILGSP